RRIIPDLSLRPWDLGHAAGGWQTTHAPAPPGVVMWPATTRWSGTTPPPSLGDWWPLSIALSRLSQGTNGFPAGTANAGRVGGRAMAAICLHDAIAGSAGGRRSVWVRRGDFSAARNSSRDRLHRHRFAVGRQAPLDPLNAVAGEADETSDQLRRVVGGWAASRPMGGYGCKS